MKTFVVSLKTSVIALCCLTLLLGVIYPLFMYGVGQVFFRKEANGSLIFDTQGKIMGSEWIGQNFTKPEYFHPRPSSAGDKGYDAANSSGSNLGPTSEKLLETVAARVKAYRFENKIPLGVKIPGDAVTSSGSGLDPHIGIENALLQAPRIAMARKVPEKVIRELIEAHRERPTWGLLGCDRVNVLLLNKALSTK